MEQEARLKPWQDSPSQIKNPADDTQWQQLW